ncbi:MAG: protein-L-isoaspartate(D-aspartate) O-methyltransferase [Cyclobacteriaceae bacterium]|nr:protein-L-isoaspartate(D-aspartate) O-methyltransferase [Cyclobacteriaceae bacterium]
MEDSYKARGLRRKLISIIKQKGIANPKVISAIEKVPRHFFLDNAFIEHAYQDKAFPIGEGQTISQPYTVAFQSELLDPQIGDKVLEIGTGSGYQACVLVEMGVNLFSMEYNKPLYDKTKKKLPAMGYRPVLKHGDGSLGWPIHAPFDGILVTAGAPVVPDALKEQLKIGGRLVIPVGDDKKQKMLLITRIAESEYDTKEFDNFSFVPLLGKQGWKK